MIKKLTLLSLLFCGITSTVCWGNTNSTTKKVAAKNQRPNIIYIMSDDQTYDMVGYGLTNRSKEFSTPHLDSLAKRGVIFDNTFYHVSICHPSRATVLTGTYQDRHQYGYEEPYCTTVTKKEFADSYPSVLRKAGYHVGFVGKFGVTVSEKKLKTAPQGMRNTPNPVTFHRQDLMPDYAFDYWGGWAGQAPKGQYWPADGNWSGPKGRKLPATPPGEKRHLTSYMTDHVVQFLNTRDKKKPFCLSVSYHAPKGLKQSSFADPIDWALFKDKLFTIPQNYVAGGPNPKLSHRVRKGWRGVGFHKSRTGTPAKYQAKMRIFASVIHGLDRSIGTMLAELKKQGVADNTIIIFSSDNGFMLGEQGLLGKVLTFNESIRAPLMVYDPRLPKKQQGKRVKALVSTVDFAPTILSLANVKIPARMQGRDFSPFLQGKKVPNWRKEVYIVINRSFAGKPGVPASQTKDQKKLKQLNALSLRFRALRTNKWCYTYYTDSAPREEILFDVENDPFEQKNLANDPKYANILKELRDRCQKIYEKAKEPVPVK